MGIATGIATALSPILVGSIASGIGGPNGWRWAFYILSVPIVLVAVIAFKLREPPRGQHEKIDVLGELIEDTQPVPPSLEAAFARIMRIRTLKMCLIAFSAMGFGLFTQPVLGNLFLRQQFGLDAFRRGLIGTIGSLGLLVALPFVGKYYDRLYHRDPAQAMALIGKLNSSRGRDRAHSVLHAERSAVDGLLCLGHCAVVVRLLHGRAGDHVRSAVPPPRHDRCGRGDLPVVHRGHRRRRAFGRSRPGLWARARAHRGDPDDDHRRVDGYPRLSLHP